MLHCRRFGEGRALVLLHGFLGGSGYWAPQISHFARMFEVIAPDLPGFAGSHAQPTPDTISGFAPVLLDFLDRISIGRFALVGHSLGGMVAQQIALDFPRSRRAPGPLRNGIRRKVARKVRDSRGIDREDTVGRDRSARRSDDAKLVRLRKGQSLLRDVPRVGSGALGGRCGQGAEGRGTMERDEPIARAEHAHPS